MPTTGPRIQLKAKDSAEAVAYGYSAKANYLLCYPTDGWLYTHKWRESLIQRRRSRLLVSGPSIKNGTPVGMRSRESEATFIKNGCEDTIAVAADERSQHRHTPKKLDPVNAGHDK
eukprot:scaffold7909_cov36-Prasinocladus_malaysianus.AAC.3